MVVVAIVLLAILTSQDGWRFFVPSEVAHFGMVIANHTIRAAGHHSRGVYRRLSLGHVDGVQIASRIQKNENSEGVDKNKRRGKEQTQEKPNESPLCDMEDGGLPRAFFFFFYLRHVPIKVSLCSRSD